MRRAARGAEREELLASLEELASWYRDLVAAAAGAHKALVHVDRADELREDGTLERLEEPSARPSSSARRGGASRSSSSRRASRSRRCSSSCGGRSPAFWSPRELFRRPRAIVDVTDADAIRASLAEPETFSVLFDRHFDAVHSYAQRRVGPGLADEIAAEAFTRAFDRRNRYDLARANARPWLRDRRQPAAAALAI